MSKKENGKSLKDELVLGRWLFFSLLLFNARVYCNTAVINKASICHSVVTDMGVTAGMTLRGKGNLLITLNKAQSQF